MTNNQKQVKDWMVAFGQEAPEKPTIPSLEVRKLRAKLILEEALETIEALGVRIYGKDGCSGKEFEVSSEYFSCITIEEWKKPNLKEIADGCSDLSVVNYGTLVACGLVQPMTKSVTEGDHYGTYNTRVKDMSDPLFDEVMRSNWSKMWTNKEYCNTNFTAEQQYIFRQIEVDSNPDSNRRTWLVKDKDGKVIKSPSYTPANLQPIIDQL